MIGKPRIIVLSSDADEAFKWVSDGWNDEAHRGTPRAKELMSRARKCVAEGKSVPEVVRKLREAGFEVERGG